MISLKCINHDDDIILIDLSKIPQRQQRTYCPGCLDDNLKIEPCHIKQITSKITAFSFQMVSVIQEEYDYTTSKVIKIIKSLNTLKEQIVNIIDQTIQSADQLLQELIQAMEKEQDYYRNLLSGMTRNKLEEIALILSGKKERKQQMKTHKRSLVQLGKQVRQDQQKIIKHQKETIQQHHSILFEKMIQKDYIQLPEICYSLASNKEIMVGGLGKNINVWLFQNEQIIESAILKGHSDYVMSVQINKQGNQVISGSMDKSIKLWILQEEQWNCIQTINQKHSRLIKLTPNELNLVSAGEKEIKVWQIVQNQINLLNACIIDQPVYDISFSSDSKFIACSGFSKIVKVYQFQPWLLCYQLEGQGNIHRIHFTSDNQIICQQIDPPRILIFNQEQVTQEIILNAIDDNCILFPIFSVDDTIYLKNQRSVCVIKKKENQFQIRQIISGKFQCGCPGSNIIVLSNQTNKRIEQYKIY